MSFEQEEKKSERANSQEGKKEKEFSLSEIDELLKQNESIFDGLNKFSKVEIFEGKDFSGRVFMEDELDDKNDWVAYEKAGFMKRFEDFTNRFNFTKFFLSKERSDLIKTKVGIFDKTVINERLKGEFLPIDEKINKEERKNAEEKIGQNFNVEKGEFKERLIDKLYEVVDSKIVKMIVSRRTEVGEIEAAGKMRDEKIGQIESVDGAELVMFKDSLEKINKSKEKLPEILKLVSSEEERKEMIAKLSGEEDEMRERIKEKEEKINDELKIFREPFEDRLKETTEMQYDLMEGFDFIKNNETNLNNKIKEYKTAIEEAKKLYLPANMESDIKKIEERKAVLEEQVKELAERKALIGSKLEQIRNNKKEIEATLNRINNIGKTKKEIAEEEKDRKKAGAKYSDAEKSGDQKGRGEKEEEKWEETLNEVWGLDTAKKEAKSQKTGKSFDKLFPSHDYPGREREKTENESRKKPVEDAKEIEGEDERSKERTLSEEEVAVIIGKLLKKFGVMEIKDEKIRRQIADNAAIRVKKMMEKTESFITEKDIKREVKNFYADFLKARSQKNK